MAHQLHEKVNIKTPIGLLSFRATTQEGDLSTCKITTCHIQPSIPKGMNVEGCIAVLLKCVPSESFKNLEFSSEWNDLKTNGCANSGEALDAWEWESNGMLVVVGIEDSERLNSRLGHEKGYTSLVYPVGMANNKIDILIEDCDKNKTISLHFVIAWNSLPESVENSCWYAVDVPHEKILQIEKHC